MTEEDKVHIFERFYRSDRVKKTGIQGTGLGLAIVKEVVEAHHGQISVSSTLNGGSTFTVSLPQDPQ
jgi:signal transduction histidine kinase